MSRGKCLRAVPEGFLLAAAAALLCLLGFFALTPHASAALYAPVSEYSFDEGEAAGTAIEDQAGENDGSIEGAGRTTRGHFGGALEFHGVEGECASVPNSESLQLKEEFTIEAWVKSNQLVGEPIVYKETEGYWSYWFGIALGLEGRPEAWIADEEGKEWEVRAPSSIEADVWTNLAVSYDGARLRLYVDGEQVASKSAPGGNLASKGPLWIGCAPPNHETFDGRIDELHVYDRVLAQADIAADMESPIETPRSGPVAEYAFDEVDTEGETETAEDRSGHGHTATIEGPTSAPGRYGASLKFDGEHDCVSIESDSELKLTEEFAVEAWVRPEGEGLHGIVTQEDKSAGESEDPFAYTLLSGDEEYEGPRVWVRNPGGKRGYAGGPPIPQGAWSHLAVTDDGGHLRFYVDGELTDTEPTVPLTTGEGPLTIGCIALYGDHFKGRIDEVRIYDRALKGWEVAADMESPIQTPRKGPVADYSFDEVQTEGEAQNVEDLSGGGHTATLDGATWTAHGRYGGALEFDAEKEAYVSIPADPGLDGNEELTVEAWVRPTDTPFFGGIAMKEREGSGPGYSWTLDQHSSEPVGYFMQTEEGMVAGGEHSLPLHTWTHVAMTDDGAHDRLYVDGQLVDTAPAIPFDGHGPIKIGGNQLFGQWFDGRIDELRIYERALSGAEVAADMEAPLQTPKATPAAEYSFDEDKGETVEDRAGEHNGTIQGAEWTEHGRYGGAMQFDGESMITIPASEDLDLTEEFTLEAWIRPEAGCTFGQIFVKEDAGEEHAAYVVSKHGSKLGAYLGVPGVEEESPSGALEIGVWQHIAVTFDGSRATLYVDGEDVGSAPVDEILSTSGDLRIGGSHIGGHGGDFVGRIDEVRIYARSLSEGEIAGDMETPIQTPKWGPVAVWSFDEIGEGNTAEDLTGDGHTATIEGATPARGKFGGALSFDGSGQCATVPAAPALELREELTVEAWIKPEGSGEAESIVFKEAEGEWFGYSLFLGLQASGKVEGLIANDPESEYAPTVYSPVIEPDAWTHVAMTYDGRHERLYIDGVLVDTETSEGPNENNGDLRIGCTQEHETGFDGRIDEVRIYDRPLNLVEVQQTMNATFPTATTDGATEPGPNDAILNGIANANGGDTEYYFEYGTSKSYGEVVTGEELGSDHEDLEVSEAVTRLAPETTYHYRLVSEGIAGTAYGQDQTFTTGERTESVEEEAELATQNDAFALTKKAKESRPSTFYGMMWSGELERMAKQGRYNSIENSGAKTVRLLVQPGKEHQPEIDKAFELAANHHLEVLPILGGNRFPRFGTSRRTEWINYAKKIVGEYGPGGTKKYKYPVTAWEIWNEPNMPYPPKPGEAVSPEVEWKVNAKAFALFMKEMSEAIRSGAGSEGSHLTILSPGLYGYKSNGCGPNCHKKPVTFLKEMNKRLKELEKPGDESVYDAISLHPYVFTVGTPGNKHAPVKDAEIRSVQISIERSISAVSKEMKMPIWVTETGFPVEDTGSTVFPPVGEKVQARLLQSVFAMMQNTRAKFDIKHVFYYNIQDRNETGWDWHCGLYTYGGKPRSALKVYEAFAK